MDYRNLHQMNLYDVFGDSPWTQEDVFLKDRDYMKKICPKQSREMLRWVEDVCDEEEYDGSCMYDEYPDTTAMSICWKRLMTGQVGRNRRIGAGHC